MSAGRDVERLTAQWLAEEAPARAPDRVLDAAGIQLDHTRQRRFAAIWREPMVISTGRLVAAAAVILLAVVAAGWIGRSTASTGQTQVVSSPTTAPASAAPTPTPAVTIASFRVARNAVCDAARPVFPPLNDQLAGVYDTSLSAAQRSAKIDVLNQIVIRAQALRQQLSALEVPPEIASDQTAVITRSEDVQAILEREIALLRAGKLSEAKELDVTTDPINRLAEQFEQRYGLSPCP